MERIAEVRHEYCAGDIYAMAGASLAHNRIARDILTALNVHLRGHRGEVFMNDMKAHLATDVREWFYYPEVMVNCEPAGQKEYYCDTPSIIFEVLSPGTVRTDRREKWWAYEKIPTLHTYVLVAQDRREVTVYRRVGEGPWATQILPRDGEAVDLPEIELYLPLGEIYGRAGI